ncbi:MAG: hypothetical protein JWM99_5141 [Verrucomicrobiales bacterium]|nr:hypothetical protein [Verrucomicrobiales bacterium]
MITAAAPVILNRRGGDCSNYIPKAPCPGTTEFRRTHATVLPKLRVESVEILGRVPGLFRDFETVRSRKLLAGAERNRQAFVIIRQ